MPIGCDFENRSAEDTLRDGYGDRTSVVEGSVSGGVSEGSASRDAIQAPGTPSAETEPMPTNSRAAITTTAAVQATTPTPADRSQPSR